MNWVLSVPVETKMMMLKRYKTLQHREIQDACNHEKFKDELCVACDLQCEHWEWEDGYCIACGKENQGFDCYEPELEDR